MQKMNSHTRALPFVFALIAAVFALVLTLTCAPSQAFAKSYSIPSVDIRAQLETDGSLHVVEQRQLSFDGEYSQVKWSFSQLPEIASITVNSVRVVKLSDEGNPTGETSILPSVPFDLKWRDGEDAGPGSGCYSLDDPANSVYVYFQEAPTNVVVELDYTIENMAQAYDDKSEIYWQYLSDWGVTAQNVSCTLELPVPKGTTVSAGDNVYAWGHGPAGGTVEVNNDGSVVAKVDTVKSGEYAELRVLVPTTWLTNLTAKAKKAHSGELRTDTVVKEEKTWSDSSGQNQISSLVVSAVYAAIAVLLLFVTVILYFRYGKEYEPDFKDDYFRDNPAPSLHPAVVGRLWRWNCKTNKDVAAAIVHLMQTGQIRIEPGSYEVPRAESSKEAKPATTAVSDYCITKLTCDNKSVDQAHAGLIKADSVDAATLHLLFDVIAGGRDALWLSSVVKFGEDNPQEMLAALKAWQNTLTDQVKKQELFEPAGKKISKPLFVIAAVLALGAIVSFISARNLAMLVFGLLIAVLLALFANAMPRRTHTGNNIVARCKALRNWLCDFGKLDESVLSDTQTWNMLMLYACQFDVDKEALRHLTAKQPDLACLENLANVYGSLRCAFDACAGKASSAAQAWRATSGDFGGENVSA